MNQSYHLYDYFFNKKIYMRTFIVLIVSILIISCEQSVTENTTTIEYPKNLQAVFEKHGGLTQWNKMNTLSYIVNKDGKTESQIVDLKNRRERIESEMFKTGFDGKNYWLEADTTYKGNAIFYHNLMFYFYAMPFVLADEGINYEMVDTLEFDGQTNIGIRVTYDSNIGVSPEDEYILYYDSETNQMSWLAYTVTYFNTEDEEKKAPKYGWIRYNDWKEFNGVVLPNSLTWYKTENNKPLEVRDTRTFTEVEITEAETVDSVFEKTENAEIVTE